MKYIIFFLLCAATAQSNTVEVNPNGCPKNWTIEKLLPHPNCNEYYQCWNGQLVARKCPENLYFNIEKNRCDWDSIECDVRITIDKFQQNENDDEFQKKENTNKGIGNNNPKKAPYICARPGSDGVLVAHEQCGKFYICDHGKPVARSCPAGLLFNPRRNLCDWPRRVRCKDKKSNEDISDANDTDEPVGAGNSDPSEAPKICAEVDSSGVLVAHEKCNKFYICDHGKPVARRCPADLYFNPNKDQCDLPNNVNCVDEIDKVKVIIKLLKRLKQAIKEIIKRWLENRP